jgi:hypothetical protein
MAKKVVIKKINNPVNRPAAMKTRQELDEWRETNAMQAECKHVFVFDSNVPPEGADVPCPNCGKIVHIGGKTVR